MSRPFPSRSPAPGSFVRVNGKIRAREVRVIGEEGNQVGVIPLHEALQMARTQGVDLVEVAPNATPPVCRLVDYGKFRYEQAKKDKESKKRHHANKVKEIQLSPSIDPHDFGVKLSHAIDFLCEEMKVKVSLRFRGREMAHKEFGFQTVQKFIESAGPYGHPDAPPKLVGRGIVLMLSPLPRNKRAKNPNATETEGAPAPESAPSEPKSPAGTQPVAIKKSPTAVPQAEKAEEFSNNPFAALDVDPGGP